VGEGLDPDFYKDLKVAHGGPSWSQYSVRNKDSVLVFGRK